MSACHAWGLPPTIHLADQWDEYMRLNVGAKLWLAFLGTITFTVVAMYLLLHSSLKQSFLDQTSQQAVQRLTILQEALANIYREEGGFSQLESEPTRWMAIKSIIFSDRTQALPSDAESGDEEVVQRFYRDFVSSISLFDRDKKLLLGVIKPTKSLTWIPIVEGGSSVGFVGFVKPDVVVREADRRFIEHQMQFFGILSVIVLCISLGAATLLTRRLSRPIQALSRQTQSLIAGNYEPCSAVGSQDEIGQLSADINLLAKTLAANEQSRAAWVADISHEMRTPLAVLKAQIEAMQDGIRETNSHALALLHQKIEGLSALVDDLFELSLSDIGALNYQMRPLTLNTLVGDCAGQFAPRAEAAGLTLHTEITPKTMVISGDGKRLAQLLLNLFENAQRYTNSPGKIHITLTSDKQLAILIVQDSAPTVPPEQRERIFDRLHRLEDSRSRHTGGAGLGLAICRNIVTAHQGTIRAEDSPLGGIALRVEIPLIQHHANYDA